MRSLIYPVPDPSLPFLGVHLTRHIDGDVSLGPTALLAPRAAGRPDLAGDRADGATLVAHRDQRDPPRGEPANARPGGRGLRAGAGPGDFDGGFAGMRAQALGRDGKLVDDFVVSETERALHVRNAPSPAATSSLALARLIADRARAAGSTRRCRRRCGRLGSTSAVEQVPRAV